MHESVITCMIIKSPRWKWGVDIISVLTSIFICPVYILTCMSFFILKNVGNQTFDGSHWLPLCFIPSFGSQWLPSVWWPTFFKIPSFVFNRTKNNSYRFGTIWRWVNDDRTFFFGWTIPLTITDGVCPTMHCTLTGSPLSVWRAQIRLCDLSERVISGTTHFVLQTIPANKNILWPFC